MYLATFHATSIAPVFRRVQHRLRCPTLCAVCHGFNNHRICAACTERYAVTRVRCTRCALPLPSALSRCATCDHAPPPFIRTVAACDYAFPWSDLMQGFKSRAQLDLAPALATMLTNALARHATAAASSANGATEVAAGACDGGTVARCDVVLPMPASTQRVRERGFNPAWEIARRVARAVQLQTSASVLQRLVHTPSQRGLTHAERRANVRGVFAVSAHQTAWVRHRRVALIDDVMTTCATASEATHALLQAGATSVEVWLLARTPDPDG